MAFSVIPLVVGRILRVTKGGIMAIDHHILFEYI